MRWLVAILFAVACHHDPPPEEPVPVSSTGTPIGFLIDDTKLQLSTDQLGTLRGIDDNLRRQLDELDKASKKQVGSGGAGVQQQNLPPVQPIGGRGRRRMGGGNSSAQPRATHNEAAADKLADERNADVKLALERVFAALAPAQRDRAKQVLSDHDIDIDLDEMTAPPPPPPQLPPPQQVPPPPPQQPEPPPTIPPPTIPPPSQAKGT